MKALGISIAGPPHLGISATEALRQLWIDAGLEAVETRCIPVERTFANFESYWLSVISNTSVGPIVREMPASEVELIKMGLRARAESNSSGGITYRARANAIRGRVPGVR
jgi:hypothetical protein